MDAIVGRLLDSPLNAKLRWLDPEPASREHIALAHDVAYIRMIEERCLSGADTLDHGDTRASHDSFEAARLSAGAALAAVDSVMNGPSPHAFACARPPGHHALHSTAMGFCLFNNIAIAAHYARKQYGLRRILILDWDVHHGNGTQDAFYQDPEILFVSLHQYPYYPGSGSARETGEGAGQGYTLNIPLLAGSRYTHYEKAFLETILPRAHAFQPELILISAGFDAHILDPLGQIQLETRDFAALSRILSELAAETCQHRLVSLLEGGYHLQALADSVHAHLEVLSE